MALENFGAGRKNLQLFFAAPRWRSSSGRRRLRKAVEPHSRFCNSSSRNAFATLALTCNHDHPRELATLNARRARFRFQSFEYLVWAIENAQDWPQNSSFVYLFISAVKARKTCDLAPMLPQTTRLIADIQLVYGSRPMS